MLLVADSFRKDNEKPKRFHIYHDISKPLYIKDHMEEFAPFRNQRGVFMRDATHWRCVMDPLSVPRRYWPRYRLLCKKPYVRELLGFDTYFEQYKRDLEGYENALKRKRGDDD